MVGAGQVKKSKNFVTLSLFSSLMLYCLVLLSMRLLRNFMADEFALDEYKNYFKRIYDYGTIFFIFGDVYQVT